MGGVPDGELFAFGVPAGHHRPVFDRGRHAAVIEEPAFDHDRRLPPGALVVALLLLHVRGEVGLEVLVDEGGAGRQRRFQIHHGVQRFRGHHDVVEGVFRHVAAFSHHHGDGLADVPDLPLGQRHLSAGVKREAGDGRGRDEERTRLPVLAQVLRRVDRHHSGAGAGGGRVHLEEPGVRVLAPGEGDVEHPVDLHVVGEERAAGEQPRILAPPDPFADKASSGHAGCRAASFTASTMCW